LRLGAPGETLLAALLLLLMLMLMLLPHTYPTAPAAAAAAAATHAHAHAHERWQPAVEADAASHRARVGGRRAERVGRLHLHGGHQHGVHANRAVLPPLRQSLLAQPLVL